MTFTKTASGWLTENAPHKFATVSDCLRYAQCRCRFVIGSTYYDFA